jgi:hypothetical protein
MKPLLLITCFAFYISSSAQEFKVDVPNVMKQSDVSRKHYEIGKSINKDSLIKKFKGFFSMKGNPGIYYLPQDNMPCLVPDNKDIAAIPNTWPNVQVPFKTNIPNPGLQNKPLVPSFYFRQNNSLFIPAIPQNGN